MLQVILKRIAIAIPVILIVASLTFFLVRMAPGGPFDAEKVVPPQVMKNLNAVYNLDAPLIIQYRDYMLNLVQGDFGPSFRYPGRSVTEMIFTGLPVTFELAFYAIIVAMIIGSLAGVIAAVKRAVELFCRAQKDESTCKGFEDDSKWMQNTLLEKCEALGENCSNLISK